MLRRRRRLPYRSEKCSTSTTWREAKLSHHCIMPNYWADSKLSFRKKDLIRQWKNSTSTMTTHRLTFFESRGPNRSKYATNCCSLYRILQTWPRVTSFCSQTCKSGSPGRNFNQVRRLWRPPGNVLVFLVLFEKQYWAAEKVVFGKSINKR